MPLFFNRQVEDSPSEELRSRLEILKRAVIIIARPDTYSAQFDAVYELGQLPCRIKEARFFNHIGALFKGAHRERHEWIPWAFSMQEIYHYESLRVCHESALELLENLLLIEEVKYGYQGNRPG